MPLSAARSRTSLPRISVADGLAFIAEVVTPTVMKGLMIRRARAVELAERLDLDKRAVACVERLRRTYGDGPLLVQLPGRTHAVVLSPADARRVLEETPDPFSPASDEKRAALGHFEPDVSLLSVGGARVERRHFSDRVLESGKPIHSMARPLLGVVEEEAARMLAASPERLDWTAYFEAWSGLVRRIVLGRSARDDDTLTALLTRLRRRGNWAMVPPRKRDLIEELRGRIRHHLDRAEPGSLAERIAAIPASPTTQAADQVAHYLFAFDAGSMASFRALALLAAHPGAIDRARQDIADADARPEGRAMLPFLRASILEALRLWSTTPLILRQSTRETAFDGGTLPAQSNVVIFAPYFHRNDSLPFAHRFAPEMWIDAQAPFGNRGRRVITAIDGSILLVPFSFGPGQCPASDFVPLVTSALMAAISSAKTPALADPSRLRADAPMPGELNTYTLVFRLAPR